MKVLAVLPGYAPSTIINVITPLQYLHEQGNIHAVIRMEWEVKPDEIASADIIVLCRNSDADYRPIYTLAAELGIPMIYDLDDHVLDAPVGSESHKYFSQPERREQFETLLRHSKLVRVHSPVLQDVVAPYNSNFRLVWAAIDWSLVPPELLPINLQPVRIVYAAQQETGRKLFPVMLGDLERILSEYDNRVHLHFLGYNPPELAGHPRVTFEPFQSDYAHYFSTFTRAGYAIGLAPMINDLFHNSKTNIKFRDYAAAGAAGIYADTPLYNGNGVINEETGLLVSGETGSWYPAIKQLIEHPDHMEKIRQNARRFAEQRYRMDVVGEMWMQDFNAMPERPLMTPAMQQQVADTKWWFTREKSTDNIVVARLRSLLKKTLPPRWKQFYYQMRHRLQKLRS